ncbi:MAG TPA: DNA polymerase III subunit delta' [Mycobacteriales bacterium]|nr:DNA polymerase III subunit delta' [Mycobacteriales bacterium]
MSVWDRVVGQPEVVAQLAAAAAGESPGHAWLIVGPAGSGRSVAARAFAAALECESRTGCGSCRPCREVTSGTHPDVTTVVTEGLSIGVKPMRELAPLALSSPTAGRARVIMIEDADRLTESAGNVLLKPLEEPGAATVFVLCAPAISDVLPTVRSRCRVAALRLPSSSDVAQVLTTEGVGRELAAFAAAAAGGHVGRARRLARDEGARERRAAVLRLPQSLRTVGGALDAAAELVRAAEDEAAAQAGERDGPETVALKEALGVGVRGVSPRGTARPLKELEAEQKSRLTRAKRDALDRALIDLAAWYRDVLVQQLGAGQVVREVHSDQTAPVAILARAYTPEAVLRCVEAVLACREAIAANVAPLLACEAMALTLRSP